MLQDQTIDHDTSFGIIQDSETGTNNVNEERYTYITNEKLLLQDFLSEGNEISKDFFSDQMRKIFNYKGDNTEDADAEENFEEKDLYKISFNKEKNEEYKNNKKNIPKKNENEIRQEPEDFSISLNMDMETEKKTFISKKRNKPQDTKNYNLKNQKEETKETDEKIQKNNCEIIKEQKKEYQYRLDYYKKAFKVACFKHLTNYLNELISKCNFPKELKKKKLFKPNNESFTSNAKEEDNYKFLFMPLKDAFCYVKNENSTKGISLQKSNRIFIDKLLNFIEEKGDNISEEFETLRKYLNMNVEEYIKIYYDTKEFENFCKEDKIQFYEREFIKEKKYPMLEKFGFLRLIKIYELNKHFSNGLKSIHLKMNEINSV